MPVICWADFNEFSSPTASSSSFSPTDSRFRRNRREDQVFWKHTDRKRGTFVSSSQRNDSYFYPLLAWRKICIEAATSLISIFRNASAVKSLESRRLVGRIIMKRSIKTESEGRARSTNNKKIKKGNNEHIRWLTEKCWAFYECAFSQRWPKYIASTSPLERKTRFEKAKSWKVECERTSWEQPVSFKWKLWVYTAGFTSFTTRSDYVTSYSLSNRFYKNCCQQWLVYTRLNMLVTLRQQRCPRRAKGFLFTTKKCLFKTEKCNPKWRNFNARQGDFKRQ